MQSRLLNAKAEDKASYLFLNSESINVFGTNNNFTVDLSNFPVPKNKGYNVYVKQLYYPSTVPQITAQYGYNSILMNVINRTTGTVVAQTTITITEGTYTTSQYMVEFARALNAYQTAQSSAFGGDQYTMAYSDITNKFGFIRKTVTARNTNFYDLQLVGNDTTYSYYNGAYGFGGAFILGMNYNSTFNLPTTTSTVYTYFPNCCVMQPYSYFYMTLTGISNLTYCSDIPQRFDIVFRCPLNMEQQKYQWMFIEEANQEFSQMVFSTLPTKLSITFIDQYNNPVKFPATSAVDVTLKLVPIE